jgi:hypothetical protein
MEKKIYDKWVEKDENGSVIPLDSMDCQLKVVLA